jgi:plastocyanin
MAPGAREAVRNIAYVPPTLSVASRTVVTRTNEDEVSHTVASDDGNGFASPNHCPGEELPAHRPRA